MDTCFIYQPHFKTNMFRVSVNEQQGEEWNFVVVTCSPGWNGVWKYPVKNTANYKIWMNGKLKCYCVPTSDCVKIKNLNELTEEKQKWVVDAIKKQQDKWFKSEVRNRNYSYKNKPEWML